MARKTDEQIITGINKYCAIMDRLQKVDVSTDAVFQKMFNGFYRMRQRSVSYYKDFYSYLEANKSNQFITFQEILEYLFQNSGRVEASFSSKMLATIRPEIPIWDTRVLANLGIKPPYSRDKKRLQKIVVCYDQICQWYAADSHTELVPDFNATYPEWDITNTKKLTSFCGV